MLERLLQKMDQIIAGQEEIKEQLSNLENESSKHNADKFIDAELLKVRIQVL